ncbi:MAG: DNA starvation/stationary phase protection protein [Alphaproteobacteria bacterium]|nr:DNA starvation/stationary phase protection protein [Alphaproteobacteria bacterium]
MTDHYTADARIKITDALKGYLADTAVVYYKTHAFHWNVEGPNFYSTHIMFEKFYTKLWKSLDDVAERIRTFGEKAPSNFIELLQNASIKETETSPVDHIMAKVLRDDYLLLAKNAREVGALAESFGDRVTTDLMTEKEMFLEKAAWMLQSTMS